MYKPELLIGVPIGMFHCPHCGEMLMAGMTHPRYDQEDDYGGAPVGDVTPDRFADIKQNEHPTDIFMGVDEVFNDHIEVSLPDDLDDIDNLDSLIDDTVGD